MGIPIVANINQIVQFIFWSGSKYNWVSLSESERPDLSRGVILSCLPFLLMYVGSVILVYREIIGIYIAPRDVGLIGCVVMVAIFHISLMKLSVFHRIDRRTSSWSGGRIKKLIAHSAFLYLFSILYLTASIIFTKK
jgi:hypothetical protein